MPTKSDGSFSSAHNLNYGNIPEYLDAGAQHGGSCGSLGTCRIALLRRQWVANSVMSLQMGDIFGTLAHCQAQKPRVVSCRRLPIGQSVSAEAISVFEYLGACHDHARSLLWRAQQGVLEKDRLKEAFPEEVYHFCRAWAYALFFCAAD